MTGKRSIANGLRFFWGQGLGVKVTIGLMGIISLFILISLAYVVVLGGAYWITRDPNWVQRQKSAEAITGYFPVILIPLYIVLLAIIFRKVHRSN